MTARIMCVCGRVSGVIVAAVRRCQPLTSEPVISTWAIVSCWRSSTTNLPTHTRPGNPTRKRLQSWTWLAVICHSSRQVRCSNGRSVFSD